MSQALPRFVEVLQPYSETCSHDLRDTIGDLHTAEDALERAALVEAVADAPWMVVRKRGVRLAPDGSVYFIGRPYDDGDVRLVILHGGRVILNELWPSRGTMKDWYRLVTDLAQFLQDDATRYPDAAPSR